MYSVGTDTSACLLIIHLAQFFVCICFPKEALMVKTDGDHFALTSEELNYLVMLLLNATPQCRRPHTAGLKPH